MVDFSAVLLFLFGLLFGFIFNDLLKEAGLKEYYDSFLMPIVLAFLSFAGFMLFNLLLFGVRQFPDLNLFYNSVPFWLTVALLIGGYSRLVMEKLIFEKPKSK